MAKSYNKVVASGSTNVFSVPYPYLDRSHVKVSVDGVLIPINGYTWITNGSLSLNAGNPTAGAVVLLRRITPTEPITDFKPGNLDTGDLNVASIQPLFVGEEALDLIDSLTYPGEDAIAPITDLTAGQTVVPIPGGYEGLIDVHLNGLQLAPGLDYTATDGDNVVLLSALTVGDIPAVITAKRTTTVVGLTGLDDLYIRRDGFVYPTFVVGNLGLPQDRTYINNVLSGAVYDTSEGDFGGDAANFLVVRYVKHTVPITGVGRAVSALVQILSVANNYEFALTGDLEDKVAQTVAVDFVGTKSAYARFATAAGTLASGWAGYDENHDMTGLPSASSGGPLRGREITMIAGGIDNGGTDGLGIRYGLDVVHSRSPYYAGLDTQFAVGVRVINAAYYGAGFGPTVVGTAFDAHGEDPYGTGSGIQIALRGWVNSIGVLIDGNPANGSFVAEIFGSTSIMKLGMKEVNSSAGQIQFTSRNNAGTQKKAFSMDGGLSDPTTGTEDGRFSMVAMIGGADVEVFAMFPQGDADNPAYIRLGGTMKKLTVDGGFVKAT